jgi:hypothetical protein
MPQQQQHPQVLVGMDGLENKGIFKEKVSSKHLSSGMQCHSSSSTRRRWLAWTAWKTKAFPKKKCRANILAQECDATAAAAAPAGAGWHGRPGISKEKCRANILAQE